MGLFDDLSKFLEVRLEEFLKDNPHLEYQAILEQLREQEQDTLKLITNLDKEKIRLETEILSVAKDIQTWHERIKKAKASGRLDLASAAQEREAMLLRRGNQLWGQMNGTKKHRIQAQELLKKIQIRKEELKVSAAQAKSEKQQSAPQETVGWHSGSRNRQYNRALDPLEAEFQKLELDKELEHLKRNL